MFPKSLRIKKSSDFKLLFTKGRSFHSPQLKLQVLYGGRLGGAGNTTLATNPSHTPTGQSVGATPPTKYAVITPKGVGKAHDRNRIRRQLLAQLRAWHEGRESTSEAIPSGQETKNTSYVVSKISKADNTYLHKSISLLAIYVKPPKYDAKQTPITISELAKLLLKL